jgi:uncharacterized membrane protein
VVLAILILFVSGSIGVATTKPLWYDELVTLYVAAQPDVGHIWTALKAGVDLNPPLYILTVHFANRVFGIGAVATRLPATVGFLVLIVCVFSFLRTRFFLSIATFGALIPALSGMAVYAYEGRSYGVVLGCAGLAMVCWQRTLDHPSARAPVVGLGVALTALLSAHFYAPLVLIPFGVAQMTHDATQRSIAWRVWSVLGFATLSLLGWLPLMRSASLWRVGFWAQPASSQLVTFYANTLSPLGVPIAAGLMFVAALAPLIRTDGPDKSDWSANSGFQFHEIIFAAAMTFIPVLGWFIGRWVTGAWTDRYAASAVIGIALLLGAALHLCGRRASVVLCSVVFALFAARELKSPTHIMRS